MHRDRYELSDERWNLIKHHFPPGGRRGGQWRDHRTVVNGILWVLCSGAAWRDLPQRYGPWQTAHRRLLLWRRTGLWDRVLADLRATADARGLIDWTQWNADTTSVRATRHAAGARRRRRRRRRREKKGSMRMSRPTTRWGAVAAGSAANCTC